MKNELLENLIINVIITREEYTTQVFNPAGVIPTYEAETELSDITVYLRTSISSLVEVYK
jgi:hypothetical protein